MFRVTAVQSKEEQEALCKICGCAYSVCALAYALYTEDGFSGICQFRICPGSGEILNISPAPGFHGTADNTAEEYLSALCRTALSFLFYDLKIPRARYTGAALPRPLLLSCGFTENPAGEWSAELAYVFSHCPSEAK